MLDQMDITGLSMSTRIGIHAWEQRIHQRLLIDINIPVDLSLCNNDLNKTIDYDALSRRVTSFVEEQSFDLIETVGEKIAALVKEEFNVSQVTIRVSKPDAIKNAANVSVCLTR
jgi:dihydroneopterin aldolase